ncbi:nuclear transport factor 2 family protein [Luteibacter sp. 9135]|uniref:nuclear transport factor 2 family protein n=1 Tax=Luteibacter sp. 9135 TaxID=1500893 RepID=UPI00068A8322|nr:DUF4440 domain-containing protein [Luteibacter sp. 9135]
MDSVVLLDRLTALETELHGSSTRGDVARLRVLLHEDFEEVGRSGVYYRRDDVLASLPAETGDTTLQADGFRIVMLSEVLALLTYRSVRVDADGNATAHTLRSSLWQMMDGHWRMRFHQGTPTTPFTLI